MWRRDASDCSCSPSPHWLWSAGWWLGSSRWSGTSTRSTAGRSTRRRGWPRPHRAEGLWPGTPSATCRRGRQRPGCGSCSASRSRFLAPGQPGGRVRQPAAASGDVVVLYRESQRGGPVRPRQRVPVRPLRPGRTGGGGGDHWRVAGSGGASEARRTRAGQQKDSKRGQQKGSGVVKTFCLCTPDHFSSPAKERRPLRGGGRSTWVPAVARGAGGRYAMSC